MESPLIGRIRKILERARHHSTPEDEALELHAKARELMLEYEVDPALVEERKADGDYVLRLVQFPQIMAWKVQLRVMAAEMFFCEGFVDGWPLETGATGVLLFGAQRHVDLAADFGEYLEGAVTRRLDQAVEKTPPGVRLASNFAKSFCNAASFVLSDRIKRIMATRKGPIAPGSNLPVPVDLLAKAKAAMAEQLGATELVQVGENVKVDDPIAMIHGIAAGKDIGLDPQLGGGATTAPRLVNGKTLGQALDQWAKDDPRYK